MLYELEWQTPHETPNGYSVPKWVEAVRWYEENGYLRDPRDFPLPDDPEHPAVRARKRDDEICPHLCWRPRCHRLGWRCPHVMPLAIREFMPELCVHFANLLGDPQIHTGPVNPDKMTILAEIFGAARKPPANPLSRKPIDEWNTHKDSFI